MRGQKRLDTNDENGRRRLSGTGERVKEHAREENIIRPELNGKEWV